MRQVRVATLGQMHEAVVARDLGQRGGDDGQAGREVLAQLERIRAQGEGVGPERDDADVEAAAIFGQRRVGL